MRTYLDCIPCFLRQALGAARVITDDIEIQRRVLNEVACLIPELPLDVTPPEIAQQVYRLTYRITGSSDREEKRTANDRALELYPELKRKVAGSAEPLLAAVKLAIGGNSIDLGPTSSYADIHSIVSSALDASLSIDDYDAFHGSVARARRILYLGDNAGEIVFDRVLVEEIRLVSSDVRIDFVVRESPIINDATIDDARYVGLDKEARIVTSGSDAPATVIDQCSKEVFDLYRSADMIIAKGQGNYESMSLEEGNIFFLLKAKCRVIAGLLDVNIGDHVLKQQVPCPSGRRV